MTFSLVAAATLVSGLLIGLIPKLVDGVQKPLKDRLSLLDGGTVWFVRLFYLTWLPAMPLAGWLLDTFSKRDLLFFGLVVLILGVAWLAMVRTSTSLMLNALFLGLGYSVVTTAAVGLMPHVFFADTKLNIASFNIGFVAVGAGALLGPWIVLAIERWWGYRQGLLYLSVALIAPAALTALCDRNLFPPERATTAIWHEVFTQPQLMVTFGFALLLYFFLENCLEFWPESYLKELGYQGGGLQASMLVFWLAFIGSRAAAAWALYEFSHIIPHFGFGLTIVLIFALAFILGNLSGGFEIGSGILGFVLLGACYGPILPGLLGMALELYKEPIPLSILGALLALSGIDTLGTRRLAKMVGMDRPARTVMRVPTLLPIPLALLLLLLAFLRS